MTGSEESLLAIYRSLLVLVLKNGAQLTVERDVDLGGGYVPNRYRCGIDVIEVNRARVGEHHWCEKEADIPSFLEGVGPSCIAELVTTAHEFGHHLSCLNGTRTTSYKQALDRFNSNGREYSTSEDRDLILNEESIAWKHARTVLEGLGFTDWADFDREMAKGLGIYRNFQGRNSSSDA